VYVGEEREALCQLLELQVSGRKKSGRGSFYSEVLFKKDDGGEGFEREKNCLLPIKGTLKETLLSLRGADQVHKNLLYAMGGGETFPLFLESFVPT